MDLNIELNNSRVERQPRRTKAIACATAVLAATGYAWDQAATQKLLTVKAGQTYEHPVDKFIKGMQDAKKTLEDFNDASDGSAVCGQAQDLSNADKRGACLHDIVKNFPQVLAKPADVYDEQKRKEWNTTHFSLRAAIEGFTGTVSLKKKNDVFKGIWEAGRADNSLACATGSAYTNGEEAGCVHLLQVAMAKFAAPAAATPHGIKDSCANKTKPDTIAYAIETCNTKEAKDCKAALDELVNNREVEALKRTDGDLKIVKDTNKKEVEKCLGGLKDAIPKAQYDDKKTAEKANKELLEKISKNGKSGINWLLWASIGVLVLMLVGTGVFMYMKKKKEASGAAAQPDAAEA